MPLATPTELEILRHSTSHVMAEAVKELYPNVLLAIGPSIDTGFYYDFDMPNKLYRYLRMNKIE